MLLSSNNTLDIMEQSSRSALLELGASMTVLPDPDLRLYMALFPFQEVDKISPEINQRIDSSS